MVNRRPSKKPLSRRTPLRRSFPLVTILAVSCLFVAPVLFAQTTPSPVASPPPDAPANWKPLIGSYTGADKTILEVLENNGQLELKEGTKPTVLLREDTPGDFSLIDDSQPQRRLHLVRGDSGTAKELVVGDFHFERQNYDADTSKSVHVTPVRPLEELRKEASLASPPQETRSFRKTDLVELATLDPSIHLDIRYASSNNFLGTPVYTQARAFLQPPAALALLRAQHTLQPLGYGLLIHDGYRPWSVTKVFWEATPQEGKIFVADPAEGSRHNRGCAVDLSLYDLKTGVPIEMPGTYDEMSPRSFPDYAGGTSLQRWHRDLLRRVMESEGFTVYEVEWWHFDYKDWRDYPILNIPFEKLALQPADASGN
jgi:D-alanyl-D-alanine dipeptidase